jgi:hypothetical protein
MSLVADQEARARFGQLLPDVLERRPTVK